MAIIHVIGSSIVFCVLLIIFPIAISSVPESETLLILKKPFANATALRSWKPGSEPCPEKWVGVACLHGVVSSLRLRNMGLSGQIDVQALASLRGLRSLGLVSNSFSGTIPDFRRLGLLKGLYLSRNQFSGEIPSDYFKTMVGLKKVRLSSNRFLGPIPSSLFNLSHMLELHLDDNQFSGTLPPLEQPTSVYFVNFSSNNLEGEIPPSLSKFSINTFKGNPGLCGGRLGNACESTTKPIPDPHVHAWFLLASSLMFSLMFAGIFVLKKRQERLDDLDDDEPSIRISSVRTDAVIPQHAVISYVLANVCWDIRAEEKAREARL